MDTVSSSALGDTSTTGALQPAAPPLQKMVTRAQTGSFKPKKPFSLSVATPTSAIMEPSCYSQAIKDVHWRRAMSEEYNAFTRNGTWELVPPSPSQNVIGCKWMFKTKLKQDGSLDRYKARLVPKGYHQRSGINFVDTFI
ncbi:putative mitochondrial protein [Nicotiana attenuata]|uniref:Mitochondrial protein n=1 Tax=Nicotiana attenuata TaxID=49451 RepID=A0A1J6IS01_NICAT|nr:putative mitochondrial protein [Nicotiana attenuata]